METILVLPNQLFEDNNLINKKSHVYIYEHPVFFTKYKYHKLKLVLLRASMKNYENYVITKYKCKVTYINYYDKLDIKAKQIDLYDPVDHHVIKNLKKYTNEYNIKLFVHDTPLFLCKLSDLKNYLDNGGTYHQTSFYIWQRKRLNILVTKDLKPIGNKWTFDVGNRLPFPKDFKKDFDFPINNDKYTIEAQKYVEKHFPNNIGNTEYYLPIDHQHAKEHLKKFLKDRLKYFGPYQDAVDKNIISGCHAIISPLLNTGLLTPKYVIGEILKYYKKYNVPLESVEAIIRQIIGWREIIRLMYMFKHKEMNKLNHFNHNRDLGKEWYTGETGIEPIDNLINKVLKYGYAHHIERLMYLSNFMLLNKLNPNSVFDWFMTCFIDSYHWVMEANIFAMGQYSTGPLLMTRPYFSASNYIDKMSSYKKKRNIYKKIELDEDYEWYEVFDALYYNFINDNKKEFSKNYAIASSVSHWNNKNNKEQTKLLKIAKLYLKKY